MGSDQNAVNRKRPFSEVRSTSVQLLTTWTNAHRLTSRSKLETKFFRSPNFRLSLSLSVLLLLHRLLHRFFTLLRQNLLHSSASTFRNRNPRIANSLTSRLAPAIGASLAGFALGLYPADQLRLTATIYVTSRAAEFGYTYLEREGWFNGLKRRGWVGSWMLMPLATGQLLHSFVFDRDCFPEVRASQHFAIWRM